MGNFFYDRERPGAGYRKEVVKHNALNNNFYIIAI